MDKRAQILLKTLVEHYIREGEPVSSRALLQHSGLGISTATIRNVMSDLERLGFVTSPHTSAGRTPTAKGYRFFVDCLVNVQPLDAPAQQAIQNRLTPASASTLVKTAADMLSSLTQFAGVVMLPKRTQVAFRHIEFLPLSEQRILLIVVTNDGNVQNRILITDTAYTASQLSQASNYLNANFTGKTLAQAQQTLQRELGAMQSDMNRLMSAALHATDETLSNEDEMFIAGQQHLLDIDDFSNNINKLKKLFHLFERRSQLLQLLNSCQKADGIVIFIGEESGYLPLDECSMVTAPYVTEGKNVGILGVIGPTRMAYERVIPIVDVTARLLSNAFESLSPQQ
ncbi:MAG: heat-inducible transcriptional repressor HrcA [Methylophilaceae bacterium]|nr:heat-inducible transcriptional repressor HrcA [Methylophilaceae bacterium]